jgi:hypothetical protein
LYGRWTLERIRATAKNGEDTMYSKTYRMIEITRDNMFITDPLYNPDKEPFTLTNNIIKTATKEYTILVLENNKLQLSRPFQDNNVSGILTLDYKR